MPYRTRSARRLARKSKRNLAVTIFIIVLILYATISWILPNLIGGLGFITGVFKNGEKVTQVSDNLTLAPPVLNISYEATSSAQIDIKGYAIPGSKVKIYVDDELKDTVDTQSDGSFLASNIELNLGTNNIFGKTVDEKNQESLPSKTFRLIYDNEKPTLEISEPEDGKVSKGERKIKVQGKTEQGSKVFINGAQVIVNSEGGFQADYSLNDGENTIIIQAQDKAFNVQEVTRKVVLQP